MWMVPPQKQSTRIKYCSCTRSLTAMDGPTIGMVFRASVKAEKWARKDEAVYVVSLRLDIQGELNNGT